jgi:hypothetical protein
VLYWKELFPRLGVFGEAMTVDSSANIIRSILTFSEPEKKLDPAGIISV